MTMAESAGDQIAIINLPDPQKAPAYLESLAVRSRFKVDDFGSGTVGICPVEGPGALSTYFKAAKLCDAATDLGEGRTWEPLQRDPPRRREDVDGETYREEMLSRGKEITEANPGAAAEWVAFALAAFGAAEAGDLPELLRTNLPVLFDQFPDGELWYVTTSDVLLARLAFARAELAFTLTPDMPIGPDMEALRAFSDLSVLQGIDVAAALKIALVALSPAALGMLIPALPHAFVFCFGTGVDLTRPYPIFLASLYRPSVLDSPEGLARSELIADLSNDDGPEVLAWWVERLNRIYSHAADPTRFTTGQGFHDATAQTAWMITFERMLGDANSLLSEPQATGLDRVQIAFDLLDKAESLLGFGKKESGKGFAALLRRGQCLPRLREAFGTLPAGLGGRLGDESERLFDGLYEAVRENTTAYRLTEKGAKVARKDAATIEAIDNDRLVSSLCRAVRNSSHGLLDILRDSPDRYLLATNTGGIPPELPALAPLIAFGLVADAEGLVDGSWRTKLLGGD
jgi:hypothetical protein